MKHILIIGAGRIGKAIGTTVARDEIHVEYWDNNPSQVEHMKPLEELVPQADVIFLCIPSFAMTSVIQSIKRGLKPEAIIVSLAKSLERDTGRTMDELLKDELPNNQPFCIFAGPLLAEELHNKKGGGIAVVGTRKQETFLSMKQLFDGTPIHTIHSSDVRGSALCGVVKNMFAIGIGMIDGLEAADNVKGSVTAQALVELRALIVELGGKAETAEGQAGFGDFIATAFSQHSGHRTFGECVVKDGAKDEQREGCIALVKVHEYLSEGYDSYPLLKTIYNVVVNDHEPKTILDLSFLS